MIDYDQFMLAFPGREDLFELLVTKPRTQEELLNVYLPSKLWRLNNLYHIVDKHGNNIKFNMRFAQFMVHGARMKHPRCLILKSRQQGISTYFLVDYFDDALFIPNTNCGLMSQDSASAKTLLERVKHLWDYMDPDIIRHIGVSKGKDNTSEITFSNGSNMYVRTSFRSATLHRLHVSEWGKIANKNPERTKETKTGTLQAINPKNPVAIESTAEGPNEFKTMWDQAVAQLEKGNLAAKDFYPIFLSWLDDPDCNEDVDQDMIPEAEVYFKHIESKTGRELTRTQRNFWISQYRELGGDIYQEYPGVPEDAFSASRDGTYYSKLFLNAVILRDRRVKDLYHEGLDLYVSMDLGRNDLTVLTFFQWHRLPTSVSKVGGELRIVDEYKNSGEDLSHYTDYLKEYTRSKDRQIHTVILPHDVRVVDLTAKGRSRLDIIHDEGITNTYVLAKSDVAGAIQLVRSYIPHLIIDSSCAYLDSCFMKYTKVWDPITENWKNEPKRDIYAHGADSVKYGIQYVDMFLAEVVSDEYGDDGWVSMSSYGDSQYLDV